MKITVLLSQYSIHFCSIEQAIDENVKVNIAVPWKISLDRISVDLLNGRKCLRILMRPVNEKQVQSCSHGQEDPENKFC